MKPIEEIKVLRELAKKVAEIAAGQEQNEKRRLWKTFHRLEPERPMIYVDTTMPGNECYGDELLCTDPFFRKHEIALRNEIFHHSIGDDYVVEPWITQEASYILPENGHWGIQPERIKSDMVNGANMTRPAIVDLEDCSKMLIPEHRINEEQTKNNIERLQEAVGDILKVNVSRKPFMSVWGSHISGDIGELRGIQEVMMDMLDNPEWLHNLLAFMRDGIIKVHKEAEKAGDWSLGDHFNQSVPYSDMLPAPEANSGPVRMKQLWGFMAAQEMTLISPEMHDEFMLQYQIPVCEMFGEVHYGCCEDLSRKIDILRQVPNLRRIAVSPWADIESCAEQIGNDYCISWRPNPSEMVCCGFDRETISSTIKNSFEIFKKNGCSVEINLKDVKTVRNEPERLGKFVKICKKTLKF